MKLEGILATFISGQLSESIRNNGPEPFERCWPDLITGQYAQKMDLVPALIRAGIDCDLRNFNDGGQTPMEQALFQKQHHLVQVMLAAEATLFSLQQMVYRLVRRGCVPLLEMFLEQNRIVPVEKFSMLSYAMEELRVKYVPSKSEMQTYCLKFLLTMFYSSADEETPDEHERRTNILDRVDIILKEILFLQSYGSESFTNIDNEFLLALDIVAENVFIVDLLWGMSGVVDLGPRSLWTALRPRKIIYCIEMFKAVHMGKPGFQKCVLLIDKQFVLSVLDMVGTELQAIKAGRHHCRTESNLLEQHLVELIREYDIYAGWKRKYPEKDLHRKMVQRVKKQSVYGDGLTEAQYEHLRKLFSIEKKGKQNLQTKWYKLHPDVKLSGKAVHWATEIVRQRTQTKRAKPFSEKDSSKVRSCMKMLNRRHDAFKNLYSLWKMLSCVNAVKDIPLTEEIARKFGYSALKLVLLHVGESGKSTLQTPNIDRNLYNVMTRQNTPQVVKVYEQFRDTFSHGMSLTDVNVRIRCEDGELDAVLLRCCEALQKDFGRCFQAHRFIMMYVQLKTVRSCLGRMGKLKTIEQCRSYASLLCSILPAQLNDEQALLFDFKCIYAQLEKLMTTVECRCRLEDFIRIQRDVQQVEQDIQNHQKSIWEYENVVLNLIRTFRTAHDLDSVKKTVLFYLKQSFSYFRINSLSKLRESNEKVLDILIKHEFSSTVMEGLRRLNQYLTKKQNRVIDIEKVHFKQFIPYQNELYTEGLLNAIDVDLDSEQFYSFHGALNKRVYNPLDGKHVANLFAIEDKFKVLQQLLIDRRIPYNTAAMDRLREEDGRKFQLLFEQMIQSLYDLSNMARRLKDEYDDARQFAIYMGLLEVCQVLSHTRAFQLNLDCFKAPLPLMVGRHLRNLLAHGSMLSSSTFMCSEELVDLTIEVLYEQRFQIMTSQRTYTKLPFCGEIAQKYERRKELLREQKISLELKQDVRSRVDIYGKCFHLWIESDEKWHNALDLLHYHYPDDGIAYLESFLRDSSLNQRTPFEYLWKRLGYSEFLGYRLQPIVRVFSIGGVQTAMTYEENLEDTIGPLMNHLTDKIGCTMNSNVPLEDLGFEPKPQIEKMLSFCMKVGRLEKFMVFYQRYGRRFDFINQTNLYLPDLVKQLAEVLPWNAVDDNGRNWIHLWCGVNNLEALQDILNLPVAKQLINQEDRYKRTPLTVAAAHIHFRAAEILLRSRNKPRMDLRSLLSAISAHEHSLTKYFIPSLIENTLKPASPVLFQCICASGNIDALRYIKASLSPKRFKQIFWENINSGHKPFLSYAINSKANQNTMQLLLSIPEILRTINHRNIEGKLSPLAECVTMGRLKTAKLLLDYGAIVDFHVIEQSATNNFYKQTQWLYRKMAKPLTDSELLSIIEYIVMDDLNPKLLKFFVEKLAVPLPYTYLESAIQRHAFRHIPFLCETFPLMFQEYCNHSQFGHPISIAIYAIHLWNSLAVDKPILKYLIDRCPDISQQHPRLLVEAVQRCDLEIVKNLLDKGVPIDGEVDGFTPLTEAAFMFTTRSTKHDVLMLLLKRGANVKVLLDKKPAYLKHIHLLETILQHTPFDSSEPHPNFSAIHSACESGSVRLVKLLHQKYQADICSVNAGFTPLEVAVRFDRFEVMRYLLPRFNDQRIMDAILLKCIINGKVKALTLMLPYCPRFKSLEMLNSITVIAHDHEQLHVFVYLHSILESTYRMSNFWDNCGANL